MYKVLKLVLGETFYDGTMIVFILFYVSVYICLPLHATRSLTNHCKETDTCEATVSNRTLVKRVKV